ncbi:MAG: hypothetical protein IJM78_03200 [Prevotella sp.]|nr:hypothetical protein [Prevotella sp.]
MNKKLFFRIYILFMCIIPGGVSAQETTERYTVPSDFSRVATYSTNTSHVTMTLGNGTGWKVASFKDGSTPTPYYICTAEPLDGINSGSGGRFENSGNLPAQGTFYKFRTTVAGTIAVQTVYKTANENWLWVLSEDNGTISDVPTTFSTLTPSTSTKQGHTLYKLPSTSSADHAETMTFSMEPGKDYYFFLSGTEIGLVSYAFTPQSETLTISDATDLTSGSLATTSTTLTLGDGTGTGWSVANLEDGGVTVCNYAIHDGRPLDDSNKNFGDDANLPTQGTYYKFRATTSGTIAVQTYYNTGSNRWLWVLSDDGGTIADVMTTFSTLTTLSASKRTINGVDYHYYNLPSTESADHVETMTFHMEAGKDYYFFLSGAQIGLISYTFTRDTETFAIPTDATASEYTINDTGILTFQMGYDTYSAAEMSKTYNGAAYRAEGLSLPLNSTTGDYADSGSLPTIGTYYKFTAKQDKNIMVFLDIQERTEAGTVWVTDETGTPIDKFAEGITTKTSSNRHGQQTISFNMETGKTYYIYSGTNPVNIIGYYAYGEDTYMVSDRPSSGLAISDVEGIVMTYGNDDNWSEPGTDQVANWPGFQMATSGSANPKDEGSESHPEGNNYTPNSNTFNLPITGSYYKFEPANAGTLTVTVLQNGFASADDNRLYTNRILYFADEMGNTVAAASKSSHTALTVEKSSYTNGDAVADEYWENGTDGFEKIIERDNNGYSIIQEAACQYVFNVEAGKTYFMFVVGSKMALFGYQFNSNTAVTVKEAVLDDTKTDVSYWLTDNTAVNVPDGTDNVVITTSNRTLTGGVWNAVVVPFSMTETQVKAAFGDDTKVIYFDKINNKTLHFKQHYYQMIVAGRPCFVKPSNTTGNLNFIIPDDGTPNRVTFSGSSIELGKNGGSTGTVTDGTQFTLNAAYTKQAGGIRLNDYFIGADGGIHRAGKTLDIKGFRFFFESSNHTEAKEYILSLDTDGVEEVSTDIAAIEGLTLNPSSTGEETVYDLQGRRIAQPVRGIYIKNGKKFIVK